jgi:hypothetical protein
MEGSAFVESHICPTARRGRQNRADISSIKSITYGFNRRMLRWIVWPSFRHHQDYLLAWYLEIEENND